MASSGGMNDEAQYTNAVGMKWSKAAETLAAATDGTGNNPISEEVQAMWSAADTPEAQQALFLEEYFHCNGPPPTELE